MNHIKKFNEFMSSDKEDSKNINEVVTSIKEGMKVKFNDNTYKDISNYEINISNKTGIVTSVSDDSIFIKLDEKMDELNEWDNELIYTDDDFDQLMESISVNESNINEELKIPEEKSITIYFENGDIFKVPVRVIALNRTEYYAQSDGFEKGSPEWDAEFETSMSNDEVYDWLSNNMDWADVKDDAIRVPNSENEPDYDKMWGNADKVIEY